MYATQVKTRIIGMALSIAVTAGILAATEGYVQHLQATPDVTVTMEPVIVHGDRMIEASVQPDRG
ncbi:MAG TPA: hypothetical protein VFR86_02935 [Burkholderiaceae bacterium]|nr:hypothetical protein [Burkholderiaceae bacterium]